MTEPLLRRRPRLDRALGLATVVGLVGWFICLSISVGLRFSPRYPRTTKEMMRAFDPGPAHSLLLMAGRIATLGSALRAIGLAASGLLVAAHLMLAANRYRLAIVDPPV